MARLSVPWSPGTIRSEKDELYLSEQKRNSFLMYSVWRGLTSYPGSNPGLPVTQAATPGSSMGIGDTAPKAVSVFSSQAQKTWQTFLWNRNLKRLVYLVLAKWGHEFSNILLVHYLHRILAAEGKDSVCLFVCFCPMTDFATLKTCPRWKFSYSHPSSLEEIRVLPGAGTALS